MQISPDVLAQLNQIYKSFGSAPQMGLGDIIQDIWSQSDSETIQIIVGAGVPSPSAGATGNLYINSSTGDVYQKVSPTSWGSILFNITGPAGTNGTNGTNGNLNCFASSVQTGNGSSQSIPHGLSGTPTKVLVSVYNNDSLSTWSVVEGVHTSTNVLVTATSGISYKVLAIL